MIVWKFNGMFNADAETVSKEIETIENATPQNILEYAKNENTELHKCFDWDDTSAANKWRLQQARQIVCNLVYKEKEETKNEQRTPLRVFYQSSKKEYEPTKIILTKKDEYEELLKRAKQELRAFKEKYKMLTELEEILNLID